ncbi:tetratricopeptide repeat protein [Streptomyces sp. NPDC019890]|uniref:tetratricopeptide repeat protein n=1 Tax=Streptomyces sp. NPDC019890 TaxID=3365064 RepID=UPI00384FC95A
MAAESGLRVLNMVEPIAVPRLWSDTELARVAEVDDTRLNEAHARHGTHGIAEYLAAGPELLAEWRRAARATPRGGHPRGAALVAAAVDLARIGLIGDLPEALLREVHHGYLRSIGGAALRPEPYADAFEWASQVRYGVASLLMEGDVEGTKRPFDYLTDSVARDPAAPDVAESVWLTALEHADDRTRPLIAQTASLSQRWAIAEHAWRPLAEIGDEQAVISFTAAQLFQRWDPAEVEPLLRPVAEGGSPLAQLNLAAVLKMRSAEEEAERWWLAAAEAGLALASFSLFTHYRDKGADEQAETWLRRAAEDGYVEAITTLGKFLYTRGDKTEAETWWRRAAEAGHTEAMYAYGGLLFLRDDDQAKLWLRRAAERGHDRAAVVLAQSADERGDLTEAERWWRVAAEAGDMEAANELGVLLSTRGERAEGATWYAKAAENGHEVAMFNLAEWLSKKGEVERAKEWHQRAGNAGHAQAFNNLGILLRAEGDFVAAEAALRRAAEAGDAKGCRNLIDLLISEGRSQEAKILLLELLGDPDDADDTIVFADAIRQAGRPHVARIILHWAADTGRLDAAHNLATQYFVEGMPEEAERWWRVAATEISFSAYNLGVLLSERGNNEEAASWWRKAADEGHQRAGLKLAAWLIESGKLGEAETRLRNLAGQLPEAAYILGSLLFDKPGDHTEAEYWWQRAAEEGDNDAAYDFAAHLAERGYEEQAEAWCRKAAEGGHPWAANTLGTLLASRGQLTEAESWLVKAVERGVEGAAEPLTHVREFLAAQPSSRTE